MASLDPPVALVDLDLPEFGEPDVEPVVPPATYAARAEMALARAHARGLDALLVYGDREHMANVAYLTGYDPRFEETLLVMRPGAPPALLVGNEGWAYTELAPGSFERVLFQSFSLLGQPRGDGPSLTEILQARGLAAGQRIGVVGWKYFGAGDTGIAASALEIPSFIADTLRDLVGPSGSVANVTDIFMAAEDGLRTINDVDQLAVFEFAATFASQALRNVIFGLQPGLTERQATRLMAVNGLPLSAHIMLSAGERASYGLPSPSNRRIERGDPLTMGYGVWGALNARAGFVVADANELPADARDYVARLVAPYFSAVVAWYETLEIGVTGDALHRSVLSRIGDPFFGVGLNPGHLIHLDEWVNSPIAAGSTTPLKSGMAIQADVIPATALALVHVQHRRRHRPGRRGPARSLRRRLPGSVEPHRAAPVLHDRRARHSAQARGSAVQQHPRVPAALSSVAPPRDGGASIARSAIRQIMRMRCA